MTNHEEQGTAYDPDARGHELQGRKERQVGKDPVLGKGYGKRRAAPRYIFSAAAHVREIWTPEDLAEMLVNRAKGYDGVLRELLCTAAAKITEQQALIDQYKSAYEVDAEEFDEVVESMRETGESDAQGGM